MGSRPAARGSFEAVHVLGRSAVAALITQVVGGGQAVEQLADGLGAEA
jgi:hypothetical protein